ncbi:serine hydrolase domain-containing protein [Bradyrhizobium tunisiense]|uniref:serine hydrolase domain-containing protein n=1 Tax=Bradyrhizobium tunisiense TaxID=3278709 RepID=UPI0035E0E3FC
MAKLIRRGLIMKRIGLAKTPIHVPVPPMVTWQGEAQAIGFRTVEKIFDTRTIRRGKMVHPLPKAEHAIAPTWTYDGKAWTIDSYMKAYRVSGLLVVKDGKILLEKYGLGRRPADRWTSMSVAKSVTSTLVGAAIQDGKIKGLAAPVTDYIPELKASAYDGVTIRQMLMMSSGVKWNEDYGDPNSDSNQWYKTTAEPGGDPVVSYMRRLPRANPPGTKFHYNSGETDLVGMLVSNAVGMPLATYASEKIWKPYGMERDAVWIISPAGREYADGCISMTLRDYARFGQFILGGGKAGGRQILPVGWTAEATSKQIDTGEKDRGYGAYGHYGAYGYFWWIGRGGAGPVRYDASGINGQRITTYRDERLVIVQNAAWPKPTDHEASAAHNAMVEAVRNAVGPARAHDEVR